MMTSNSPMPSSAGSLSATPNGNHVMATQQKIEAWSIPEPNSGCWIWLGCIQDDGYCRTYHRGSYHGVHRVSWEVHHGKIPDGLFVLHRCDVRCCVNPDHLFLGTHQDNMDDMVAKGRHVVGAKRKGEDSHRARLTEQQARRILTSSQGGSELAVLFGVSRSCISQVRRGLSWKHLR